MLSAELKWILRKFPPRSSTTKNGATQHVADPPSWWYKPPSHASPRETRTIWPGSYSCGSASNWSHTKPWARGRLRGPLREFPDNTGPVSGLLSWRVHHRYALGEPIPVLTRAEHSDRIFRVWAMSRWPRNHRWSRQAPSTGSQTRRATTPKPYGGHQRVWDGLPGFVTKTGPKMGVVLMGRSCNP